MGELVLHIFGAATPERIRLSDRICAGLQVTEHLQDVAEDRARGRVYLPGDDLARFGCTDADLLARAPSREFAELMAFEVTRARSLLASGAPLIRRLEPRAALAVAGFVAGGAPRSMPSPRRLRRPRRPAAPDPASFGAALLRTLWRRR